MKHIFAISLFTALTLSACARVSTPTPTATIVPASTPIPMPTSTPTHTPIPTDTPAPTPTPSVARHPYYPVVLTEKAEAIDNKTIYYAPLFEIYGKQYPLGIVEEKHIATYGPIESFDAKISAVSTGEIVIKPMEIGGKTWQVYYFRVLVPTGPEGLLTPALVSITAQDLEGNWVWQNSGVFIVEIQEGGNGRLVNTLSGINVPTEKLLEAFKKTVKLQILLPQLSLGNKSSEEDVINYLRNLGIPEEKFAIIEALTNAEVDPTGKSAMANYEALINKRSLPPDFYLGNIGVLAMPLPER